MEQELKEALSGKTEDQKKIIKYFWGSGGCLSKGLSDEEYESMVMAKARSIDFRKKALNKIGLDESQVNEVAPIHFEGYIFDDIKAFARRGRDGLWRSSKYQITWLFFSSTQVYVYYYTFNMDSADAKEKAEEFFYKDIINCTTVSDTVEKRVPYQKGGCKGGVQYKSTTVEMNKFALTLPGDKFYCAMKQNDYTEKAIQGMKAKLREKKG